MSGYVFIGYASLDRPYVERLAARLDEAMVDARVDHGPIEDRSWPSIQDKIDFCAAFLVVLTPATLGSRLIGPAIARAIRQRTPIFPLVTSDAIIPTLLLDNAVEVLVGDELPSGALVKRLAVLVNSRVMPSSDVPSPPPVVTPRAPSDEESLPDLESRAGLEPAPRLAEPPLTGVDHVRTLVGHTGPVASLAWSPDGERLATVGQDDIARVWDVSTGAVTAIAAQAGSLRSVAWSPDGRQLAVAGSNRVARVGSIDTGAWEQALSPHGGVVTAVAWSPDGRHVATASNDWTLRFWDSATGRPLTSIKSSAPLSSVAWSPNGAVVAAAGQDGSTATWDFATATELRTLRGDDPIEALAWSPNGDLLVTAGRAVHVWAVSDARVVATLAGHTGVVHAVVWSPGGRYIATASDDRSVRLWDAQTYQTVETINGHKDAVHAVSWSSTGDYLATAGADTTVRIWRVR